jgi:predicted nucleic acid-binding protein
MTCYAVIDTNVLVSALLSSHDDSATVLVVGKLFSGEVIPLFSDEIIKEYNEVLRRKNFEQAKIKFLEKLKQWLRPYRKSAILFLYVCYFFHISGVKYAGRWGIVYFFQMLKFLAFFQYIQ